MANIIEIKNFSKSFGDTLVIDDLSFDVHAGEIFAFLGANGSGKTTTIRTLLGIFQADSGELLINGQEYGPEQAELLGYLPEERGLYLQANVLETMTYFGQIKGLSQLEAKERSMNYLERVELADKAKTKIQKLSSGQQQKIQLGITIINRPKLLILDEPTKGLDPVNRNLLLEILLELQNENGSTIVFSTHQMDEAEKIADRLVMIKQGRRALYGEVNEVKHSFGENTIRLGFAGKLPQNDELYTAKVENRTASILPKDGVKPREVLSYLVKAGIDITNYQVTAPSLQEIFIKVSQTRE